MGRKKITTAPRAATHSLSRRIREASFIVGIVIALFLLLSFASFANTDPGWSSTGAGEISNIGGRVGAWFADVFLYMFGISAYWFPIMLVYATWLFCFRFQEAEGIHWPYVSLRALGFILLLLSCTALASIHLAFLHTSFPNGMGGVIGHAVGLGLNAFFNKVGATLLLIAFLLAGITLFTGLSWFGFFELFGRGFLRGFGKLLQGCSQGIRFFIAKWRARQLVRETVKAEKKEPALKPTEEASTFRKTTLAKKRHETPPVIQPTFREERKIKAPAERQPTQLKSFAKNLGLPALDLLNEPKPRFDEQLTHDHLTALAEGLEVRLQDFGVAAKVRGIQPGPVITRFELDLAPGVKVSKITGLSKDLARSLSVVSVRVVEVIPGKSFIGIEVPNDNRQVVTLHEVLESKTYQDAVSPLTLALGMDIAGHPFVVDLQKMPHLLVAGTTGSGKSVALNAMLLSLLYKVTPDQVRFIMIDPKMLELSVYEGIPHLLTPVVTDMKEASNALRWCVAEMDRRYRVMSTLGVRNLAGYNTQVLAANEKGKPLIDPLYKPPVGESPAYLSVLPSIVVLIDEYADMMMVVGKKVEELIARIAQKARAAGIHLILATQRPSVDVITGLIKANIPTRIAFQVSQRVDSRTIIDQQGAEQLLGNGDMLYLPPGSGVPVRVHGAFVSDDEVHKVVSDWRLRGEPQYIEEILKDPSEMVSEDELETLDPLYDEALKIVTETQRASISYVQRRLKIGYNRAASLLEEMERQGVVTAMETNGSRDVLAPPPPRD